MQDKESITCNNIYICFQESCSSTGSDSLFRSSRPRRALRDRNYSEQEVTDKPKHGGKRKRVPNTSIHQTAQKSDSLSSITNFSEFDDYSLVISGSPVVQITKDSVFSPHNLRSQNKIETSTPCAKRTCSANDINNLSVIDHVEDDVPPSPSSVQSEQSLSGSESVSRLSSSNVSGVNNRSKSVFRTSKDESIASPVNPCLVQLEKLRQSFLSMHVSRRNSKQSSMNLSESLFSTFDSNGSSMNCVTAESKLEISNSGEDDNESDTEEDEEIVENGDIDDDLSKISEEDDEENEEDSDEEKESDGERNVTRFMLASPENEKFLSARSSLTSEGSPDVSVNESQLNRSHFVSIQHFTLDR